MSRPRTPLPAQPVPPPAARESLFASETWTCPHGTTYSGSEDFISGARNAHDEFCGLGICPQCHGTNRIKVKGFTDGKPRGTAVCPSCLREGRL